ncbi:organomercurial lyase MerB [Curtobacterium sp. B18]|uniref:organomercurial lyase MerB n=1 Tax=Curtobacterium sp. B18 TaxID=95614 RepID=UPI00034B5DFC|nr:organomercurial lyase MerB [Curtobacterium sp. B18]
MTENTSLADRLTSSETGQEASLWLPLLNLLAQGDPVEFSALAAATGRTEADVREALAAVPDIEYEYGRIIGQGLTLRPTPHRFEVNGEQLYTWCALDTLIFPTLLGTSARVESVSPASGNPINVTVGPDGVQSVSPETAVVSLVNPDDMTSLRSAFCNQVHYFTSTEEAHAWIEAHPGGEVLPVTDAYALGQGMARTMIENADDENRPAAAPGGCC